MTECNIFFLTWLQYAPAPSGTDTPPEVAYGGLHAAHVQSTNKEGRGMGVKKKVAYLNGKMFPEINYLCQKETGAAV